MKRFFIQLKLLVVVLILFILFLSILPDPKCSTFSVYSTPTLFYLQLLIWVINMSNLLYNKVILSVKHQTVPSLYFMYPSFTNTDVLSYATYLLTQIGICTLQILLWLEICDRWGFCQFYLTKICTQCSQEFCLKSC